MNRAAHEYLKDLQQAISSLIEEYEAKLEVIEPESFTDDINESVFTKLDESLYEIETIMSDIEEGYYSEDGFEDDSNNNDDNFDEF